MRRMLLSLGVCSAALAEPPRPPLLSADGLYPLALDQAAQVFRQCSRGAPEPGDDLWAPTRSEISELEAALPAYMAGRKKASLRTPPETGQYLRQYVGFTRNGTRQIYGNFFHSSIRQIADQMSHPFVGPVVVCDGGPAFWGIVYNPATKAFEEPQFNGP